MKKTFISIFLIICLLPLLVMTVFPDLIKNYENRAVSRFPDEIDLDFATKFQEYFSDNFGLRSVYVSLNSILDQTLLNDSPNSKVIQGKNGWLYFDKTINDYMRSNNLTEDEIHKIYVDLKQTSDYLQSKGITFLFTIAPNKNSIYPENMPLRFTPNSNKSNLQLLSDYFNKMDFQYIDLYRVLMEEKDDQQLYHKKDTHWNNYGAYLVYYEILSNLGVKVKEVGSLSYQKREDYFGDLQKMLTPAFKIYDQQIYFDIDSTYTYKNKLKSFEDMLIETNKSDSNGTIVMFRDSFANALIPYISNSFNKAVYLRAFPYDLSKIEEYAPDYVIIEIAERNIPDLIEMIICFACDI